MYRFLSLLSCLLLFAMCQNNVEKAEKSATSDTEKQSKKEYAIVVHGGAGTILKSNMTLAYEKEIRKTLHAALDAGEAILKDGGAALDAVEQAIQVLENDPNFNAGKGAVFTNEGKNALDASIMDGATQEAGAVGGLSTVKNPISAARAVLEHSTHVLLTGNGGDKFAEEQGLAIVDPSYFFTQRRWESLQKIIKEKTTTLSESEYPDDKKNGTVGCVALDKSGNIVAGTSTGGMTNKRYGRFGDVPIIGAGTYAASDVVGVSCTGHGEYFIRYAVAHDVYARMKYLNEPLDKATNHLIFNTLNSEKGNGGLIAIDRYGNVAMPFNSAGMYRGYATPDERKVAIYEDNQ